MKNPLIDKISLDEAAQLGFKLFKANKEFNTWAQYKNQPLVTIQVYDKNDNLSKFLDLCYLKSGRGENIQISTLGGGSISEDVYGYLTTITI